MKTYQTSFTLVLAFLFLRKEIAGQSCYTPDGQQGHCVPLNECPTVFEIFANPTRGSETYLRQFLCTEVEQLKVCCGTAANITVLKDHPPRFGSFDIVYRKALKYCSPWHRSRSIIDLAVIVRATKYSNVEDNRCLGILVNPRYVITPAQCVVTNTKGQQFTLVRVKFRGKNNDSATFGIEEAISHPFFDPVAGTNDIALLRLNQTVSEDNVQVLCNGELNYEYLSIEEEWYSTLALSTIERGLNTTTVSITLLSPEECEKDFQKKGAHVVLTDYDECVKNVKNVTKFICNEFTGVPLFVEEIGKVGYIGFSSSRTVCKDGLPVIYTKVDAYKVWLIDQMKPWPINSDPCTAPNGEIGECWYLDHCPALLDAFSSVTNVTEDYLRGFSCESEESGFPVCCVTSSNSTIVLKKDEPKLDDVPIQFLETRLCGMQHRDDYFSSSAAIIDEFPWIAFIEIPESPFRYFTGTLINARYVLSTCFCVWQVRNIDTVIVQLGNYNRLNERFCVKDPDIDETDCTETYGVEDRILHPFCTGIVNDIDLLRLNKTVPYYTDFIRPICLPIPGTVTPKVGDTMYMSSWGFQNDHSKGGIKKKVLAQLVHEEECQRLFPAYYDIKHRNIICTSYYQNNTDIAVDIFDQGAPLMFHNNYRWYIAGIVGFRDKDPPGSYVNISKYINWIIDSMEPW